jgi:hypothetical protein
MEQQIASVRIHDSAPDDERSAVCPDRERSVEANAGHRIGSSFPFGSTIEGDGAFRVTYPPGVTASALGATQFACKAWIQRADDLCRSTTTRALCEEAA